MTTEIGTTPLEIQVHLEDGRVAKFQQTDPTVIKHTLDSFQPTRVFAQKVLMFGDDQSLSAFQVNTVARIDLVAPYVPDYPFYNGVLDIQMITPDEFKERYTPKTFVALQQHAQENPGEPITVFSEFELVNGQRLFQQVCVRVEERLPLEQGMFVSQLFHAHGLHGRCREGGVVVVNPTNILRFTLYPPPPTLPPGAWAANRIIE